MSERIYKGGFWSPDFACSWPFAKITVQFEGISVLLDPLAKWLGFPQEMIIKRYDILDLKERRSWFGSRIQIEHSRADLPRTFVILGPKDMLSDLEQVMQLTVQRRKTPTKPPRAYRREARLRLKVAVRQGAGMNEKKRPTCVSVIGWVWILLGGLMCFSAVMGLFASLMMHQMAGADPKMQADMPTFVRIFPLLALAQVGLAILAIVAGVKFLKLQAWARTVLEGLTWFSLTFVVGFGIFWVIMWCSMSSRGGPPGFTIFGVVMGVASLAFYGVPMGIVLKFLRGKTVKDSMQGTAEQSPPAYPEGRADAPSGSAEA